MGYYAKDGSYVYDSADNQKRREQEVTYNPTGETGSGSIYDADTETLEGYERMIQGQKSRNDVTYNPTGETGSGSILDADSETLEGYERMIQGQKRADQVNQDVVGEMLTHFPESSDQLIEQAGQVDFRLDLMKKLVEGYRDQFFEAARKNRDDYSKEASQVVNDSLTRYLCVVENLKRAGYDFGSTRDAYIGTSSGYDAYKASLELGDVIDEMHRRRKEGADIEIPLPVDYDMNNIDQQATMDAVVVTNIVDKHLKNNSYIDSLWQEAGYVPIKENSNSESITR